MSTEVWKSFEENQLTHSAAHYLMTINHLIQDQGYARVTDIAKRLNITRGSCSISLKPLKKRGLVGEDDNRFLVLSSEGKRLAELVERNDELLESFFCDVLDVDPEQAEIDACKIEHLLSLETSVKLANFMECVKSDKSVVKQFLKEVHRNSHSCAKDTGECAICHNICFFEKSERDSGPKQIA